MSFFANNTTILPTILKKTERGPFRIFNIHSVAIYQKIEGGHLGEIFFQQKSLTMPKKLKGGSFGLSRYCMLRGKRENTFLVQFAGPNDSI